MKSTLTASQQKSIADYLAGRHIPSGLGDKDAACSIAAINIALTGKLTDTIPPCMSEVIGVWVIRTQDAMPDGMRNSDRWRSLLPLAAGTGREHERERIAIIMDWMWETVLPDIQPIADEAGFGAKWRDMCVVRSAETAREAARAARAAWVATAWAAEAAAWAAREVATAEAAKAAAVAAAEAAEAAKAAAEAAWEAAWERLDPVGLLERLIECDR